MSGELGFEPEFSALDRFCQYSYKIVTKNRISIGVSRSLKMEPRLVVRFLVRSISRTVTRHPVPTTEQGACAGMTPIRVWQ
jgi:hypothetical protein